MPQVTFPPFAYVMDRWRWGVFSGEYEKVDWMHAWMELSEKYQGIVPPALRHYDDFDPGAKFEKRIFCLLRFDLKKKNCFRRYHIAADVEYSR